ncbi:MAG: hypothetical protein MJ252_10270 [archaeon]|nr:hypothetical protein [archaeon]
MIYNKKIIPPKGDIKINTTQLFDKPKSFRPDVDPTGGINSLIGWSFINNEDDL